MKADVLKITSDLLSTNDYILVTDITDYLNFTREEYAIALFVMHEDIGTTPVLDPDMTDYTNPGITGAPGEWYIPITNKQRYEIEVFLIEVWDALSPAYPYAANAVVYEAGNFYVNIHGGGCATQPSADPTDWQLLDETKAGGYDYFNTAIVSPYDWRAKDTVTEDVDYQQFVITRTDCHIYNIHNTTTESYDLIVTNYLGEEIFTVDDITDTDYAVTLEEDNVYIFQMDSEFYVEIDFCDLKNCIAKLIKYVLCNCDDPCAEPCSDVVRKRVERYRSTLNKMMALWYPLLSYVYYDRMKYVGIFSDPVGMERYDYITKVGEMIDKLELLTGDCGSCDDDSTIDDLLNDLNCN